MTVNRELDSQRLKCSVSLGSDLEELLKFRTGIFVAFGTVIHAFAYATFSKFTHIAVGELSPLGPASITVDLFRLEIRAITYGPFLGNIGPLAIVIRLRCQICATRGTVQPT